MSSTDRIIQFVHEHNGATIDECVRGLQMAHQSCSPRFRELTRKGLLEKTSERRKTSKGMLAYVYVVPKNPVPISEKDPGRDAKILRVANQFLRAWDPSMAVNAKTRLITQLVKSLEKIEEA